MTFQRRTSTWDLYQALILPAGLHNVRSCLVKGVMCEVLTTVTIKITALGVARLCGVADTYHLFQGTCYVLI